MGLGIDIKSLIWDYHFLGTIIDDITCMVDRVMSIAHCVRIYHSMSVIHGMIIAHSMRFYDNFLKL